MLSVDILSLSAHRDLFIAKYTLKKRYQIHNAFFDKNTGLGGDRCIASQIQH